jgi:hypothetical protein
MYRRKHEGKKKRGRQNKKWIQEVEEDVHRMEVIQWRKKAKNRTIWKQVLNQERQGPQWPLAR